MTFSFCKSLLLSLLVAAPLLAQAPKPATPTPAPKPKEGYVRFWNMLPEEAGDLNILHDTGAGEPQVFAGASPANYSAGYFPVKPGRYALKVVRVLDPKTPLKTFDLVLRADVYVTFLAQVKDHALSIEMLDDTYDREKTFAGRLTIRHLLPGAKISVTPTDRRTLGPLTDGAVEVLDDLPLKSVLLKMKATLPNGKTRDWTSEVDFRGCRHASLLLALDPYGRFRPRLSADGQSEFSEPAP
jgi:hypothetical protein